MAEPTEPMALVFHNDGGELVLQEIDADEFPGIETALEVFCNVIKETLARLVGHRDFKHVSLQETDEAMDVDDVQSPFSVCVGTAQLGPDGSLASVSGQHSPLDLLSLLTAKAGVPGSLGSKVVSDENGVLTIMDPALDKKVDKLLKAIKPVELLQASLTEDQEQVLVDAFMSLAPLLEEGQDEASLLEPVHPNDLLTLLVAYVAENLAAPEGPSTSSGGGNPIGRAIGAVRGLFGEGARRLRSMRKVVWKLEDIAVGGAKLGLRVARHSVRPLLVGLILNRALETLESSRQPEMRMARMTPAEQMDYSLTRLMGSDWRDLMEEDFLAAAKDVNDGYMTDDYRDEKRKMAAAMLRRLELEDWDKERMRHFYYGSYGLGPWYFDMEERLHNPYFMGARAWNGPIESWVGKSKAYQDAVPAGNVDLNEAAIQVVEAKKGTKLGDAARARLAGRNAVSAGDLLLSNELLTRVVDKAKLRQALA